MTHIRSSCYHYFQDNNKIKQSQTHNFTLNLNLMNRLIAPTEVKYADTAKAIQALDLIIGVDTMEEVKIALSSVLIHPLSARNSWI